jgi:hypothetical protein
MPLPIRPVKSPEQPMSPSTIVTTLAAHPDLNMNILRAIANSLLSTIAQCKAQAASKMCHLREQIRGLHDHVEHYENQFKRPPDGYVANEGHIPHFYITLGNGVHCPAKWVKRLEDGRVTSYHEGQGPNESPYVIDLYAQADMIGHGKENPIKPIPAWFCTLLLRPSSDFAHLQHKIEDLDDWGLARKITRFCKLDQEATDLTLQVKVLYEELNTTCDAQTMSEKQLVLTRVSQKTARLENLLKKVSMLPTYSHCKNSN